MTTISKLSCTLCTCLVKDLCTCILTLNVVGIGKLSTADGKALTDPEVLRKLTSSVSCALDEAAQALHRMRAEQQSQLGNTDR